jgi:hypothetical protein
MGTKATEHPSLKCPFIPSIQQNMLHSYKHIREGKGQMEFKEQTLDGPIQLEKERSAQGEVEDKSQ